MKSAVTGADTVDAAAPAKKLARIEARQHAIIASVCCAAISGLSELAAKSLSASYSLPRPCQPQAPKTATASLLFVDQRAGLVDTVERHVHSRMHPDRLLLHCLHTDVALSCCVGSPGTWSSCCSARP